MKDKETQIEFKVIDNNTGKEADIGKIALEEDWAKDLMYCDMQGFAILDDGNLILLDECGKFEYCPSERFSIKFEDSVVLSKEEYEMHITQYKNLEIKYSNLSDNYRLCKDANETIKQHAVIARKETAEKIFNEIYQECKVAEEKVLEARKSIDDLYYKGFSLAMWDIKETCKELAKQFEVKIKE